jgi:flagellar biosynthetic protein FliR
MNFTVENLEFYLMIIVRISGFVLTAPFFSLSQIPRRVKTGLSVYLALVVSTMIDYTPLEYAGVIGFALLITKELLAGVILGFSASVCSYILNFAGQLIDMEIGFSMVNVLDPVSKIQTTITGNLYSYFVMLMLMVTNMHYYLLRAIIDSFKSIPLGQVSLPANLYEAFVKFMVDYFVIGFRIILPIFAATLLINVVLGVLAKAAPQMNMFVIGMQLKVMVGLAILWMIIDMVPEVSDFIFVEMRVMTATMLDVLAP